MARKLVSPKNWPDYNLIDSGNYEKLERFGDYVIRRPEPQAIWNRQLTEKEWEEKAHATFSKEKGNPEKGEWKLKKGMPEQWFISYVNQGLKMKMRLGLTSFRHIGIFPEQSENWNYIYWECLNLRTPNPKVLNLFAYTGGASLAAAAAGATVYHVDSVKPVVTWARENMEASGLKGIHWVVEDALKFVKREVKRKARYSGIILDPPAYGRGPEGEKWLLEDNINELTSLCTQLLEKKHAFLVMNLYSMGYSDLIVENLLSSFFPDRRTLEFGDLFVPDDAGNRLPLGVFGRLTV